MLHRGPHLRTCAGAWGFLGEHAAPGEAPADIIRRAVREEVRLSPLSRHDATRSCIPENVRAVGTRFRCTIGGANNARP
jgi:hypothetical protein